MKDFTSGYSQSVWLVMLIVGAYGTANNCCSRFNTTTFNVHIASRHIETNKWNILTSADRTGPKDLQPESKRVVINVVHSTTQENGLLSSKLATVAVLNMTPSFTTPLGETPVSLITATAGYVRIPGLGMYKMHIQGVTWEEAKDICEKENAHLLIINSQAEANVLKQLVKENYHKIRNAAYTNYFFLGFHDHDIEGEFVTVLGKPLQSCGYNKWMPGSPRGWRGENCGAANEHGLLLDTYCSNRLTFICEFDNTR